MTGNNAMHRQLQNRHDSDRPNRPATATDDRSGAVTIPVLNPRGSKMWYRSVTAVGYYLIHQSCPRSSALLEVATHDALQ